MTPESIPPLLLQSRRLMVSAALCCAGMWCCGIVALAQDGTPLLQVFLDCDECDDEHIRTQITWVNYVRDQEQADVHVFVTHHADCAQR